MPDIKLTSEAVGPSEIEKIRQKLDKGFTKLAGLINAAEQPLPTKTGDGTYIPEANDDPSIVQKIEAGLKDLSYLGINDIKTLIEVQDKTKNLTPWDDKAYLVMESSFRISSSYLPATDGTSHPNRSQVS